MLVAKTRPESEIFAHTASPAPGSSRAVVRRSPSNSRLAMGYVAVLIVTVVVALLYMGLHASIVMARQQVTDLERTLTKLQKDREGLEVQIAELSSVERIEKAAREQLDMREGGAAVVVATLPPDDGPAPSAPVRPELMGQKSRETVLARLGRWIASIGYAQASTGDP